VRRCCAPRTSIVDEAEVDVDEGGCCALRGVLEGSVVVVPAVMLMLVLERVVIVDAEGSIFVSVRAN
jgi:hypothetical protein